MSSMRPMSNRRRSQSAYDPLSTPTNCDPSWGKPMKRAYPASSGTTDFSSFRREVDSWHSKRRRRDSSPSETSSDEDNVPNLARSTSALSPKPTLPSSSAEFDLFPRKEQRQRHSMYNPTSTFDSSIHNQSPSYSDLARIRSNAFWELRRSVAENGEGFVRRMRDYEQSRARSDAFSKVKDAQKRGRKRSLLLARRAVALRHDTDSEEDDIRIVSGHLSEAFLSKETSSTTTRSSRSLSLDSMDEDPIDSMQRERCTSPYSSYHISDSSSNPSSAYMTNSAQLPDIIPSSPKSASSASSSSISSQTPPPFSSSSYASASRSEKALAALSLAMANGAGSITEDYEAIRAMQPILAMDDAQVGEMWR
ncbi:hypothetical protein J3R30DRAFT_3697804 [Lentinula aciculospora]|uniref:Uncharacterized protein n=1 Tax=Lentinula aciculospora TaxID=153920 RepID=A0A9W9AM95_9AGAR|nr:hypothetical protein J3R30DRAFT_3697804 [Lentinula aciculospora]